MLSKEADAFLEMEFVMLILIFLYRGITYAKLFNSRHFTTRTQKICKILNNFKRVFVIYKFRHIYSS